MKNILIVYKSETGFTEKYAKWLSSELSCDMIKLKDASLDKISDYHILIYGAGLYAGKINGFEEFEKIVPSDKKLVLFATGATDMNDSDTIQRAFDSNLSKEKQESIPHFYALGGLDYDNMCFKHKVMMKGLLMMLKKKNPTAYNAISKSFDGCDFKYLSSLVDCVKSMIEE